MPPTMEEANKDNSRLKKVAAATGTRTTKRTTSTLLIPLICCKLENAKHIKSSTREDMIVCVWMWGQCLFDGKSLASRMDSEKSVVLRRNGEMAIGIRRDREQVLCKWACLLSYLLVKGWMDNRWSIFNYERRTNLQLFSLQRQLMQQQF